MAQTYSQPADQHLYEGATCTVSQTWTPNQNGTTFNRNTVFGGCGAVARDVLERVGERVPGRGPGGVFEASKLPQDQKVSKQYPDPPDASLNVPRRGQRAAHNRQLLIDIRNLPEGAEDVRVNQQQVNADEKRVGLNRPDLQYTLNGRRYYIEYEGPGAPRGLSHVQRILANDPYAAVTVVEIP